MIRKTILICFLALTSFVSMSQTGNGGISQENASLRIEYQGVNNGITTIKVINKDTCTENIRVQWGSLFRTKNVDGLSSDTFMLPTQTPCLIIGSAISTCRSVYYGTVEINYCQIVPITFEYLIARQVSANVVEVEFKLSQSDGEKQFNIQFSKDGINYKTVSIVAPEPMVINKVYKIKVKI